MKKFNYVIGLPELCSLRVEEGENGRFYFSPNGMKLASVTTVLGHFKKAQIIEWRNRVGDKEANAISGRASVRGTKFHNMLEKYLKSDSTLFEGVMPDMRQAFNDVKSTIDKIDNIHYIESPLYSESLGVAGRTDVIAEFCGVPSIIDFKTSLKPKREEWITNYFEQGTAYSLMYEEMLNQQINQIVVIIAVDGQDEPQVFIKDRNYYIDSLTMKIEAYKKEHEYVC